MNLNNLNNSWSLIESDNLNQVQSILYCKNYTIKNISKYKNNIRFESLLVFNDNSNEVFENDIKAIMDSYNIYSTIIKYNNSNDIKRIYLNGFKKDLEISDECLYETYVLDTLPLSFKDKKSYWKPNSKSDFKEGMIIEYFNMDKWIKKEIIDPNSEWEKMLKLLIKYDKIRIEKNYEFSNHLD